MHLCNLSCELGNRQAQTAQHGLKNGNIAEHLALGSAYPDLCLQASTGDAVPLSEKHSSSHLTFIFSSSFSQSTLLSSCASCW